MLASSPTFWRGTTVPTFPVELKPEWRGRVSGYWLLNQPGPTLDLSGNDNIGTPEYYPPGYPPPLVASSALGPLTLFQSLNNGVSRNWINVPNAVFPAAITQFTLRFIVAPNNSSYFQYLWGNQYNAGNTSQPRTLRIGIFNGNATTHSVLIGNSSGAWALIWSPTGALPLNQISIVTVSWIGSTVYFAINGTVTAQTTYTGATCPTTGYWQICNEGSGTAGYNGLLGGVLATPFGWTPSQIKADAIAPFAGLRPEYPIIAAMAAAGAANPIGPMASLIW